MLQCLPLHQMTGDFEIQTQPCQVMTDQIVQFTRNAQTLGNSHTVTEKNLGRSKFRIHLTQLITIA